MWRIIATTNPYQGCRKSGFKYTPDRKHMIKVEESNLSFTDVRNEMLKLLNRKCNTTFSSWREAKDDLDLELWSINATVSVYKKRYVSFELDGVLYGMEKY